MRCTFRAYRVAALLAVITTCCLIVLLSPVRAQVYGRYERPDLGVAFWLPKTYNKVEATPGTTFLCLGPIDDKYTSRIYLQVKTSRTGKLPDNQSSQMIGQMEQMHPGYQSTAQGRFLLNKTEAVMVTGIYPAPPSMPALNGRFLNNCMVTAIRNGRVFTFVFTTTEDRYKKELPAFVRMMDTLRWIPVKNSPANKR